MHPSLFLEVVDDWSCYLNFAKYKIKPISEYENAVTGLWLVLLTIEVWIKGTCMRNITSVNFQSILLPPSQQLYSFFHSVIYSKHVLNPNYIPDTVLGPEETKESTTDKREQCLMDLQSIVAIMFPVTLWWLETPFFPNINNKHFGSPCFHHLL